MEFSSRRRIGHDAPPCPPPDCARATRSLLGLEAHPDDPSVLSFLVVPHLCRTDGRFYGGAALAVALAASEAVTGRPALWSSTQLVATADLGSRVRVDVEVVAAGRSVSQVNVRGTVDGQLDLRLGRQHGVGPRGRPPRRRPGDAPGRTARGRRSRGWGRAASGPSRRAGTAGPRRPCRRPRSATTSCPTTGTPECSTHRRAARAHGDLGPAHRRGRRRSGDEPGHARVPRRHGPAGLLPRRAASTAPAPASTTPCASVSRSTPSGCCSTSTPTSRSAATATVRCTCGRPTVACSPPGRSPPSSSASTTSSGAAPPGDSAKVGRCAPCSRRGPTPASGWRPRSSWPAGASDRSVRSVRRRRPRSCTRPRPKRVSRSRPCCSTSPTPTRARELSTGSRLFGLVNNAGYTNTGAVEDVDDDEARDQLETMVIAPMRLARLALPAMRDAGEGRIVNVSSIYGRTSTPLSGWYQASKHALEAVSDALRIEVAVGGDPRHPRRAGRVQDRHLGRHGAVARRARRFPLRAGLPAIRAAHPAGRAAHGRARPGGQGDQPGPAHPLPRARYLVGYDAMALAVTDRLTPTVLKDRVLRATLGL